MADDTPAVDPEKVKAYAANIASLAQAIEQLEKSDGWAVFMALFQREKQIIYEKDNYDTLADFKGDRKAIEIVDGIIDIFKGYKQDASDAATLLTGLSPDDAKQERGIMIIEAAEESNRESQ